MGLFDKIFGDRGKRTYTRTQELMPEDDFWQIIQTSFDNSGGHFEEQQVVVKQLLRKRTPQEILFFDNRFKQLRGNAYDWQLWGAIYLIHGGCSDDSFMDFREWLIAQGKVFYYNAIQNPESLVDVDHNRIEVDWEGIGYIPRKVFEEITGMEMPDGFRESDKISGREWNEEGDDLKNMFPLLWAKYGN